MRKPLLAALMGFYLALLFYLTLVFHTGQRVSGSGALNLAPFRTIAHFLRVGGWELVVNVFGNLAALVPLGFLVPILRASRTSLGHVAIMGAALSGAIETLQYFSGRRVGDVDDVLLNTLGAVLGYAIFRGLQRVTTFLAAPSATGRRSHAA